MGRALGVSGGGALEGLLGLSRRVPGGSFWDGLWGVLSEAEMFKAMNSADTLELACQNLVNAANAAGGPDNISVVLAKMIG